MPGSLVAALINHLLGGPDRRAPELHRPPSPWPRAADCSLEMPPLRQGAIQSAGIGDGDRNLIQSDPLFESPPATGHRRSVDESWGAWGKLTSPGGLCRACGSVALALAGAHAIIYCLAAFSLGVGISGIDMNPLAGRSAAFEPVFFPKSAGSGPHWWEPSDRRVVPAGPLPDLRVPRIIHQTYRGRALPRELHALARSWQDVNPSWQVRFYDDEACLEMVRREFPEYLDAYRSLRKGVEKSDFFRYMVVLRYGGVYADIDTECKVPLDGVIRPEDELVAGWESEVASDEEAFRRHYVRRRQVLQWVFAAAPGHPALRRVCDHIARSSGVVFSNNTNRDTLERTGPGAWTDAVLDGEGEGGREWRVRLLPRVAFGVHPAGVDGLTVDSAGIIVQHHFLGSWKFKWGWRKKTLASEVMRAFGWRPKVVQDPIKSLGRDTFPVSVSFDPPFSMFVNLKGQGDMQSGADVSEMLSLWGAWQAGLAPTRGPRVVDVVVGSLGSAIKDLVFVDVGAGLGLFSLAAAARGHRAIAFEASASSLPALRQSLKSNGFQDLVDVQPMPLGHRNETICVDTPLRSLRTSADVGDHVAEHADFRRGYVGDRVAEHADFRRGYGDRNVHGMVEGCRRVVRRGTLDSLLGEEMRIGALRVSAGGWTGWILEGGLELIRHQMPNAIHLEITPSAMRGVGYAEPQAALAKLHDMGYEEAYHAGPVCDERWFNSTRKARIKGPFSHAMEDKLSQPVWCNLPRKDYGLMLERCHPRSAENVLFLYREGQGRRPARVSEPAGELRTTGASEGGQALSDKPVEGMLVGGMLGGMHASPGEGVLSGSG